MKKIRIWLLVLLLCLSMSNNVYATETTGETISETPGDSTSVESSNSVQDNTSSDTAGSQENTSPDTTGSQENTSSDIAGSQENIATDTNSTPDVDLTGTSQNTTTTESANPNPESTTSTESFSVTPFSGTYYVATEKALNVRSGPSTDYDVIDMLSSGQEITVTGKTDNNWYQINVNQKVGFVSAKYVSEQPPVNNTTTENTNGQISSAEAAENENNLVENIRSSIVGNHIIFLILAAILILVDRKSVV